MKKSNKMSKKEKISKIEKIREFLIELTNGCSIQGGLVKGKMENFGWPCGTCTTYALSELIDNKDPMTHEHNEPIDRINEIWRGILQIREAKTITK